MNKRFFNQQNLTRRLRMLFVLFAMLLLPIGAWAENYPITVAGIQVTDENAANVLNDDETATVSFTPASGDNPATLTLNGATIDMSEIPGFCPIESSIANLTIQLIGYNTLTPNSDNINGIRFTDGTTTGNLTFTTSNVVEEYGSLSVEGIYQFSDLTLGYNVTNSFTTGEQTGWSKIESGIPNATYKYVKIDYIAYYDVWIGGVRMSSSSLSPVSGGTVYIPSSHTLHLAGYGYGDEIKSGLPEFIVEVSGSNNSVSNITFEGDTPGTIIFKKDESSVSGNKVDFTGSVKGFSSVTITPPLQLVSPSGVDNPTSAQWNSFTNVSIADFTTTYNIAVGGKNVTNANASDVLGDGTVSYDSENNILTLNDATIIPESEEYGITYTGTTDLVISLNGTSNVVKGVGGCPAIGYFNNDVQTAPSLTFTNGSETDPCKLQLESVSTATIGGFGSVVNTGLYKIDETILGGDQPNTYKTTITSTLLSGGSGTSAHPFIVGTADDLKNFAKYVNDGILSTEYIKLGGNIDCTNLTGFEPIGNTIGNNTKSFIGTFNGDGNSITGLTFSNTNPDGVSGLFGEIGSIDTNNDAITRGTVKNLTLNGCQFGNGGQNGAIAGYLHYGTIENCTVTSCTISSGNSQSTYSGGITGMVYNGIVKDCTVNGGTITSSITNSGDGYVYAGGIVAYAYSDSNINGCTVTDVSINSTGNGQNSYSGGIVGYSEATISGNSVKGSTTVNSSNNDNIETLVGAIVANKTGGLLTENYYDFTVKTKTTIGNNDPVEKSGYTERAVGGSIYNEQTGQYEDAPDISADNGAVMYTKTLTLTQTDGVNGVCESYEPLSDDENGIWALAPGLDFDIDLAPKTAGMVISAVSLVYTPTGGSEQTVVDLENEADEGLYNYVHEMPNVDATLNATLVQAYDLRIAGTRVTEANAGNVLGDGTVSYDAENHKLTLNGANINLEEEEAVIDYSGTNDLTICLKGTNTIQGYESEAICGPNGANLIFTRDDGDTGACSLQLTTTTENSNAPTVITGFNAIQGVYGIGDASISNALTLGSDAQVSYSSTNGLYTGEASNPTSVSSVSIIDFYSLTIGDVRVTSENAADILGDETVTFSPAAGSTPATLTLNGFEDDCNITSAIDNLNVVLTGSNSVGNIVKGGEASASISFSGTGSLTFDATEVPSGFSDVTYGDNLAMKVTSAGAHIITPLEAPVFWPTFNDKEQRVIELRNYFAGATVTYSLTYANTSLATQNKTDETYTEAFVLKGPATITTKATIGSKVSAVATAYYFGAETNPMTFTYGDSFTAPTLVPNVEGVSIKAGSYESSVSLEGVATVNEGGTSFTLNGVGKGLAYARVDYPEQINYTVLNATDSLGFCIEVVPPEPAIAFDNDKTYLDTDNIVISLDETYATYSSNNNVTNTIYYSWAANPTTGEVYSEGAVTAQTGTLTAWVVATVSDVNYESAKATQEFAVKTDISGYTVSGLAESETYTGSAIVPEFTVKATETATTSLTANTDYTVSYKKVGESEALTDVTSMVDAGSYKIIITGAGNYGGSISKDFEIARASCENWTATGWTSPEAKADLTFTNEAKDLITGATVPDGVTVNYCYKYSTSEFDEQARSELPDPANWTTTVPQGTNAGYYAVFYKVEESANYEGWGPCEVALQTSIAKAAIEAVTVNITGWEFGGYNATTNAPSVTADSNPGNGEVTYLYKEDKDGANFSGDVPSAVGSYIVQATVPETANYQSQTGTATFSITAKSITDEMVTLSPTSFVYSGVAQTPTVTVKDGETPLTQAENAEAEGDYTVAFSNNTNAALSTSETAPTVTIIGKGNYTGTATKTFTIDKAQLTVTADDKTYNVGGDITLTVTITGFVNDETKTVLTAQPTASCDADVTKPGSYTITVNGGEAANYDFDYKTGTLTINRLLDVSFSASNEWVTYYASENLATPEGLQAYQVTAVGTSDVTSSPIYYIPANTAILLKNVSGNVSWSGISASAYTGTTSDFDSNKLKGSASAVEVESITTGTVYILINNMFRRATGTIPARRGYLVVNSSNAPQLSITIGDDTTGIGTAGCDSVATDNDEWYSIDGMKLNGQPQKPGLYIKNGKKVVINKK